MSKFLRTGGAVTATAPAIPLPFESVLPPFQRTLRSHGSAALLRPTSFARLLREPPESSWRHSPYRLRARRGDAGTRAAREAPRGREIAFRWRPTAR